jgi:TatD DNase family protein
LSKSFPLRFLDAHTHAQFKAFDSDRDEVISRALAAGIGMINVGTEAKTSQGAVRLAHNYENVWAAVGLHPIHAGGSSYHDKQELEIAPPRDGIEFDYDYYKQLAEDKKVIAVGECGLDYFRIANNAAEIKERQKKAFLLQIKLAEEVNKPLMIHCRNAFPDLIEILIHNSSFLIPHNPGVIHFFSGTKDEAKKLLAMGFYFTFGGVITFARDYDEVIKMIPLDRILSETDAPYVAPVPYRGKRNEPLYVIEVVKRLAALKNLSVEAMAVQILKNAENCFNLKLL